MSRSAHGTESHELGRSVATSDASEERVVAQLAAALLFERLVEAFSRPREAGDATGRAHDAVFELVVDFVVGRASFRCLASIGSFDRVRIAHGSVEVIEGRVARPCRLADLVDPLDLDARSRMRLRGELEQTLALCRWNAANLPGLDEVRRDFDYERLESAIDEGHPYHPCFKARTGFTLDDHRDFGPESGREFRLEWLAIPRRYVRTALPADEASFFERELGEAAFATLLDRLSRTGGDLRSHALVPAHPWQLRSLRNRGLDRRGRAAEIVALGPAGDRYRATQSVRTLINVTDPTKANVKVPLDIICTSSHRNLVDHFVCTAPKLSQWISALIEGDEFLRARDHAVALREYAAAVFEADDPALEGRLGVIFRESVCGKLDPGEAAVPFNALALVETDGRPFVADWIATYGVERWVDRLLEVVLVPIWHLLVHHGVAFESHAQNLILIHSDGFPQKVVLRDFHDTTEYVADYLRDPHRLPDFAAIDPHFATVPDDDGYRMGTVEDLRELFMDTVYVFNLADLAFVLARFHGFAEADFWASARRRLDEYARSGVTDRSRIARIGCDAPEILVESLLKKKFLDGGVLDFYEHRVRNSLHG